MVAALDLRARCTAYAGSRRCSSCPSFKSQGFDARFTHGCLFSSMDPSRESTNSEQKMRKSKWNILLSKLLSALRYYQFSKRVLAARVLLCLLVFLTGYRLGAANMVAATASRSNELLARVASPRKYSILCTLVVGLVARDVWRSIPSWAKPAIVQRSISDLRLLLGFKSPKTSESSSAVYTSSKSTVGNELSDLSTIAEKLNGVLEVAQRRLSRDSLEGVNLQASLLALLRVLQDLKAQRAHERDELYDASADPNETSNLKPVIKELVKWMDLADAAYNELPNGKSLKDFLNEEGYNLIKHDATAVPGYLGHYVAIHRSKKEAIIGIKGTSNLEDLITDMCGAAKTYLLEGSFVMDSPTSIRAHEGILLSTERLADDLQPMIEKLLIPQDYNIIVVGHSLGAASAALLVLLLRSRLPILQESTQTAGEPTKDDENFSSLQPRIKAYAFASPPTLDLSSALACRPFVTTIINNSDLVSRSNAGPVLVTMEVLKAINEKIQEREGGKSNGLAFTLNLLKQLSQQNTKEDAVEKGLLKPKEFTSTIDKALDQIGTDDDDQLFVPGSVILMYNLWEEEERFNKKQKDMRTRNQANKYDFSANRVVSTKPTAKVLRFIDFDKRMLEDHMAPSYKSSLLALSNSEQS